MSCLAYCSLIIQSILPVKNALESNQAKLWLWGKPATGDLKRPFKAPAGPFGEFQRVVDERVEGLPSLTDLSLIFAPLKVWEALLDLPPMQLPSRRPRRLVVSRSQNEQGISGKERQPSLSCRWSQGRRKELQQV